MNAEVVATNNSIALIHPVPLSYIGRAVFLFTSCVTFE